MNSGMPEIISPHLFVIWQILFPIFLQADDIFVRSKVVIIGIDLLGRCNITAPGFDLGKTNSKIYPFNFFIENKSYYPI
jgi:hypothetical protein